MTTSPAGGHVGSSWRSAHIHWRRRRPSSLSWPGGESRRRTRTGTGLRSPPIALPANQRERSGQGSHPPRAHITAFPKGKWACTSHREVSSLSRFRHSVVFLWRSGDLPRCTNTSPNTWEQQKGQGGQQSPGLWGLSRVRSAECSKNCYS